MKHSLEEVRLEYDRLDALCGVDSRGVALSVSTRATRRLGLFRPGPPPEIILSAFVLDSDELFWDTVRHEYAHAVVWLREPGSDHGHDAVWKAVCRQVGCAPRSTAEPDRDIQAQREARAKYLVQCKSCGQTTYYLREGKVVRLLRGRNRGRVHCLRCGGREFRLTVLK